MYLLWGMEKVYTQLKTQKGFPPYLLCETLKGDKRRINFLDTKGEYNVGDSLLIDNKEFQIEEFLETRVSGLDYGIKETVNFFSVKCKPIYALQ